MPEKACLSALPLECLQLVLCYLQDDRPALASLLRVSRHLKSATLPLLYSRALETSSFFGFNSFGPMYPRCFSVVRLLLMQLPRSKVNDLLCAAFDLFPEEEKSRTHADDKQDLGRQLLRDSSNSNSNVPSSTNFISYISDFDFEVVIFSPEFDKVPKSEWDKDYPPRLRAMVFESKTGGPANDTIGDGCYDEHLLFPPPYLAKDWKVSRLRYGCVMTALRRDLTWTLCSPVFEQIQKIVIPLSDIDRYLHAVERFRSLVEVIFKMDEFLVGVDAEWGTLSLNDITTENKASQRKRKHQFMSMIAFVERHSQIFPNLLRTADCPFDMTWPLPTRCPIEIMDEMKEYLPAVIRPERIDSKNWKQVVRNLKETDLSAVDSIGRLDGVRVKNPEAAFYEADPSFLSRCRSLRSLDMATLGPGSFQWAVKEKIAWDQFQRMSDAANQGSLSASVLPSPLPPIQLDHVMLSTREAFKDELDDIVFAFGETLTSLCANSLEDFVQPALLSGTHIGRNWHLPELRYFCISTQGQRLLVDPDFLASGDRQHLGVMELQDMATHYHCHDLYTCQPPTELFPRLNSVVLQGWPALTFHPDTLHLTPNLENLRIGMAATFQNMTFIPPVQELLESFESIPAEENNVLPPAVGSRPRWTWDWYLPHLKYLSLSSEFAYMFKFLLLASCPSLAHLFLNISTMDRMHSRTISVQDLMLSKEQGFVVAPSLKQLFLYGRWVISDEVREVLFGTTFSKLEQLYELETLGYTLAGWLSSLKTVARLRSAHCGLEDQALVGESVLRSHGLVPYSSQPHSESICNLEQNLGKKVVTFSFRGTQGSWTYPPDNRDESVMEAEPTITATTPV